MKQCILILAISISLCLNAQEFQMLGENTAWRYDFEDYKIGAPRGTFLGFIYYELEESDTIVDGTHYRKLQTNYYPLGANSHGWIDCDDNDTAIQKSYNALIENQPAIPVVLLREVSGKVYVQRHSYVEFMEWIGNLIYCPAIYQEDTCDTDQLLYDFTLKLGDPYPSGDTATVSSVIEVVTPDGVVRKLFTLSNGMEILEGVGCIDCAGQLVGYQSMAKEQLSESGNYIYLSHSAYYYPKGLGGDAMLLEWSINTVKGTAGEIRIENGSEAYVLQGRKLQAAPAKGLYIRGGKKYLVR
jgi:hypothetical protein